MYIEETRICMTTTLKHKAIYIQEQRERETFDASSPVTASAKKKKQQQKNVGQEHWNVDAAVASTERDGVETDSGG